MFGNYHYPVFVFAAVKSLYAVFLDFEKFNAVKIVFYAADKLDPKIRSSAFKNGEFFSAKVGRSDLILVCKAVVYGNSTANPSFGYFYSFDSEFFCKLFVTDINSKVDVVSDAFEHGVHVLVGSSEKDHAGFYVPGSFMHRKPFCRHKFVRKSIHDSDFYDVGTAFLDVFCALNGIIVILDKGFGIVVERFSSVGKLYSFYVSFKKQKPGALLKLVYSFFHRIGRKKKRFRRF